MNTLNTLVTYFSATGTTAAVAQRIAEVLDAPLYEIVPKVPYSAEDLNWRNSSSRSSVEMRDLSSRPAFSGDAPDLSGIDTLLVGFPIWWYTAPRIIHTFLEACDLNGKTVFPFATSGSSSMGDTCANLLPSCPGATLMDGVRFEKDASIGDIRTILRAQGLLGA